ncbi:hypothetical protein HOY82DRAFT_539547 [Tuber indicum]|nr:hypothetical protein HOY82DRAFT_539547 [Tuber indicum]
MEDSMRGLVRRRNEELYGCEGASCSTDVWPTKKPKNTVAKNVEKVLLELATTLMEDKEELEELQAKPEQKSEDLMLFILGLKDEIKEYSEHWSHDAYFEREPRNDKLVLILQALSKDGEM